MQNVPPPPPPRASATSPQPVVRSSPSSPSSPPFLHLEDEEEIHAHVRLPLRPNPIPTTTTSTTTTNGHPSSRARNAPGLALRLSETPPVPPPRPESTLSPHTRDITNPSGNSVRLALGTPPSPTRSPVSLSPGRTNSSILGGITSASHLPQQPPPMLGLTRLSSTMSPITLTAPRPGLERNQNLYVDAPLKKQVLSSNSINQTHSYVDELTFDQQLPLPQSANVSLKKKRQQQQQQQQQRILSLKSRPPGLSPEDLETPSFSSSVIKSSSSSKKPLTEKNLSEFPRRGSNGLLLSPASMVSSPTYEDEPNPSDSIICSDCGRCRCVSCRTARPLPEKWLCSNTCHMSAETIVDTLSCMWLVKAVMYHCSKDMTQEGDDSCESAMVEENPCSCNGESIGLRWACIGATSALLPCLCCYLPFKACVHGIESLYQQATSNGCRCIPSPTQSPIQTQPRSVAGSDMPHFNVSIKKSSAPGHAMSSESQSHQSSPLSSKTLSTTSSLDRSPLDSAKKSLLS
ncbi:hypothetical protein TCAL_01896 [Tigriopus californicus]|uniref:Sprouty n=1 Tax=Tigriopus californicus TaxID=6832 RepID=A0A553P5R6_TIGCA|nr:protein sprouty-like [Tigriopus californicus]XP_059078914.1 protein sprouty-like [Tigriopus californicus]XP_059078915.1 protein sprouty-like [Tigriopus californicus]XP_059078916.1 protein sprouty-like [Tigriopus californicus]XP_059078917.1 protein sprouty-like [Tigriopus californicus]XP_059078918.1 protein sprouty-like [Tigriopus californicus]TRY73028.1 hypothetical protein TCAL_01896 [Tigriopus californicus]|eukprot:TCALIF_01896-PA protein Name:"Similar to sty Protein sprouty (Drosophila melanogaster)" AED:0.18 eAED:0.21 QI:0/-1/0/1/-1/1/1/0/516